MELSKYNIFSKLKESNKYFILNSLSGNADILEPDEAKMFLEKNFTDNVKNSFIEKGYLSEKINEEKLFRRKYLDFIDSREHDEIQIFYAPRYSCNFECSYCFQKDYKKENETYNPLVIDAFFKYIESNFKNRKKYITVFGGEPLLPGIDSFETIKYLVEKSNHAEIDLAVVTNGYHLMDYIDILKNGLIREIQVTLDGTEEFHNKRRVHKGQIPTFNKIVSGIDLALKYKMNINLRFIADRENIENLAALAKFAINRGWTKSGLFKTQIGRNYDLHFCQSDKDKIFTRISLYEELFEIIKKNPDVIEFHKPAYSVSKFLSEKGKLPDPLFDSCPACKTEWAFDYTGSIYPCTAMIGKEGESVGTFYPEEKIIKDKVDIWQNRDIASIAECKTCSLSLACGGGCGSVAKEEKGSINAPDCRPVKELLEMGMSLYCR